jgi:hypothetical protein
MISYLYRYDKGVKGANAGYARIELQGDKCRITLQLQDALTTLPEMEFFIQQESRMETIFAGKLMPRGNGFYARVETERNRIMNTEHDFSEMDGLILRASENVFYATTWKDITIHGELQTEVLQEEIPQKEVAQLEMPPKEVLQEDVSPAEISQENVQQNEIPQEELPPSSSDLVASEEQSGNRIFALFPRMYPFEIDNIRDCVRLDLKDMGHLPVRYWSLAGNPFLIHGYYCYRHLIFTRDRQGKCAVGVPGIFSRENQRKATECGFKDFQTLAQVRERQGAFGYWLYYVL